VTFIASVVSDSGTTPTGTVMIKNGNEDALGGVATQQRHHIRHPKDG
jgi:hypothetical protein